MAFPGLGVDTVDLARVLHDHDSHPLVGQLAKHVSSRDWSNLDINDIRVAQPAVYTASVLQATDRLSAGEAAATFGHSMGELSALAFAGTFSATDGLELIVRRAELIHVAHIARPGAMAVVMRIADDKLEWVRRQAIAETDGVLELAVDNGPGQLVLSGDAGTVERAVELVVELEGVARRLPIGAGGHSPLFFGAVEPFGEAIDDIDLRDPLVPVVSSTTAQVVRSARDVRQMLTGAFVLPVRWLDALAAVRELGIQRAVDAGPGWTLANLARFNTVLDFTTLSPPKTRAKADTGPDAGT